MGSAQSARRIQPGGGSGRAGGPGGSFPLPVPPDPCPRPPSAPRLCPRPASPRGRVGAGGSRGWAGGAGGGAGGGPPPGRRPAAAGRISTAAVRRDRLRDGWEGRRGRWLGGCPVGVGGGGGWWWRSSPSPPPPPPSPPRAQPSPSVTAPRQQGSPNPGAEGARPVAALSPLPARTPAGGALPRGRVPRGGARRCPARGGRAAPPTARPLSHPGSASNRVGRGGADCPQCAPGGSRRRARGVAWSRGGWAACARARAAGARRPPARPCPSVRPHAPRGHAVGRSERTGSAAMSAPHPTRLETRTKESNTCASQGLARKPPWRNEGEGRRQAGGRGGIPRPLQSAEGAPPARLARRAGEVAHERTC